MEEIVETGKRYKGYGVSIREYCKKIGISLARWYMLIQKVKEKEEPVKKARGGRNVNALTEEEKDAIVKYKRYHSSLKFMTPNEWYCGEPERIESERRMKLQEARLLRRVINCNKGKDSLFLTAENSNFV